jgi:hypothetical protein
VRSRGGDADGGRIESFVLGDELRRDAALHECLIVLLALLLWGAAFIAGCRLAERLELRLEAGWRLYNSLIVHLVAKDMGVLLIGVCIAYRMMLPRSGDRVERRAQSPKATTSFGDDVSTRYPPSRSSPRHT